MIQETRDQPSHIALNSTLPDKGRTGGIVRMGKGGGYEIVGTERMRSFLMTLISESDHWMFITSGGALTAGRKDPDHALFPYYTQDKIEDQAGSTGSRTLIRRAGKVWEPYARLEGTGGVRRCLRKTELGNEIVLEEEHEGMGLSYAVSWRPSERFGFVRVVTLRNVGGEACELEVLDGLVNVLPSNVGQRYQNEFSNLGNAYKQSELLGPEGLGVYHLSSVPTDLAEPMESLLANVVWQVGLEGGVTLLSETQIGAFLDGTELQSEERLRGLRGAYLKEARIQLGVGEAIRWTTCADVDLDLAGVERLRAFLGSGEPVEAEVEADCQRTEERLHAMLVEADGVQRTRDRTRCMRHLSNTLFNLMRGGTFPTGYALPVEDLLLTVKGFNHDAARELEERIRGMETLSCSDVWSTDSPFAGCGEDELRLVREYLPLSFSRRHGDPSRPWNRFAIEIKEADGRPRYAYQGNWRDIFQNWEALCHSYPEYLEAAICRFLNASSADGYNPYRVTKEGFDWEVPDPEDPWANIGYWGDHQIIYLLRLLEASVRFHPGRLRGMLEEETFVYADIPYRIRSFAALLEDPRDSVEYDTARVAEIERRVEKTGMDGKLLPAPEGGVLTVSLVEKLLTPLVAKLSNFIPGGGIWMNTQRPEWNDANNALVGYGVSVVTLGYICRYLEFLLEEFGPDFSTSTYSLSRELADVIDSQSTLFSEEPEPVSEAERLRFMEELGQPASAFRETLYTNGLSAERREVPGEAIRTYLERARRHVVETLLQNRRADGLWHSYNLMKTSEKGIAVDHLYPMLEGQVSILSAGVLDAGEILTLLTRLRESALYRKDQDSYCLYPDREMPGFFEKNRVPGKAVEAIRELDRLLAPGKVRVLERLPGGDYAFNGAFHNADDLAAALERRDDLSRETRERIHLLFEDTFNHHAFTGRSGTFFAYEGLGSIYWHMVSKLALAVEEACLRFREDPNIGDLVRAYRAIRDGLGVHKDPHHYGAFPTDAYSHTPAHAGAQQPGMTGQVKEDLLARLHELGVVVARGMLTFDPWLLEKEELLEGEDSLPVAGEGSGLALPARSLGFTFCGVPVRYLAGSGEEPGLQIHFKDGTARGIPSRSVPADLSKEIFLRTGRIARIDCRI